MAAPASMPNSIAKVTNAVAKMANLIDDLTRARRA